NKREEILAVATTHFGRDGHEDSKWADVAAAVGIGSTALYHYFESKLHCLYVIMAEALASYTEDFERSTEESGDSAKAIVTLLRRPQVQLTRVEFGGSYRATDRVLLPGNVHGPGMGLADDAPDVIVVSRLVNHPSHCSLLPRLLSAHTETGWR